ncbi:MAG: hypothetical protein IJZ10_03830 [Thermoguttaceae bacterium]|nr:hypothetical protein [Thermoguttaceae bacterium]
MSARYQLTCPRCQRQIPIETSQAGQTLPCECGESLRVPTMLKMKRLPLWGDDATGPTDAPTSPDLPTVSNASKDANVRPSLDDAPARPETSAASNATPPVSGKSWGLFAVAAVFTLVGAFFFCRCLQPVNPIGVFYKRVEYASGDGKTVRRDSSPIDYHDYSFYFLDDTVNERVYYVDDNLIDNMSFFHSFHYLDSLKKLEMSDNFYENYEAMKSRRVIFLVMYGVLTLCGLALALFALFAPQKRRNVGAARGDAWR